MAKYVISTDTCCDLSPEYVKEHDLDIHPLFYRFDDEVYGGDNNLDIHTFHDRMRNGEMPTTMASNPEDSKELFLKRVKDGYDVIHIAFSSGLSSSCQNAKIAAEEVMEEFPGSKIVVIDSLSAAPGQGLLVYRAIRAKEVKRLSFEDCIKYIEDSIPHIAHHFTVNDLFHLHRGGRVSKATAIVGTLAGIKPNLCVDNEGHLVPYTKCRGRKKALVTLVDTMEKLREIDPEGDVVMIGHDDTTEDAEFVASQIRERLGIENIILTPICPTIAAHTGPGIIALFFYAKTRQ